jgi:hypothetical protein
MKHDIHCINFQHSKEKKTLKITLLAENTQELIKQKFKKIKTHQNFLHFKFSFRVQVELSNR